MNRTPFFKMTGSGNDFVMLDARQSPASQWSAGRIRAICDRRMGVGADGLVVLAEEGPDVVRMHFWNCDGSVAAMCGNAALCSTRLAARLGLGQPEGMTLVTGAGRFRTRSEAGPDQAALNLTPVPLPQVISRVPLLAGERSMHLGVVGVPHLVVDVEDLEAIDLMGRGRELRFHPELGSAGANVNFVALPPSGPIGIRTYERGVEGETLACGTGTVAAGVVLAMAGRTGLPAEFRTRSGMPLRVSARLDGESAVDLWLGGEGRLVFEGVWPG
ncbi:MAG TPA: diaminopimelate epimerase [Gemmatimonadales bacterium]|nr:diaminopimelate epimerase [Gemmatimonadales bacterium]